MFSLTPRDKDKANSFSRELLRAETILINTPGFSAAIEKAKENISNGNYDSILESTISRIIPQPEVETIQQAARKSVGSTTTLPESISEEVNRQKLVTFIIQKLINSTDIVGLIRYHSGVNDCLRSIFMDDKESEKVILHGILGSIESAVTKLLIKKLSENN
jgi:hypothetical protein